MPYPTREAALNWLALGLLLAAWNATDDGGASIPKVARPAALRGYSQVTVRALQQTTVDSLRMAAPLRMASSSK